MKLINTIFISLISGGSILAATYDVPVPPELTTFARWNNIKASATIKNDQLTINYQLPDDLVGNRLPAIIGEGKIESRFVPVGGSNVSGYCLMAASKPLTCLLHYPPRIVDIASRDQSLNGHFNGIELANRSSVAHLFSADPAGILMVDLN